MGARLGLLAVVLALLALAPPAHAAARYAGAAASTITACRGDGFTAAASVRAISARTRRPARLRGTRLQVRLDAVSLFGLPRPGRWRDLGSRSSGTVQESFAGLSFDTWTAVVRYRYRRGRKTVLSGDQRSESRRVGRSRGRAFCTIDEGAKPRDSRPPFLFLSPGDDRWRRGPLTVQVAASDDFSGVAELLYRVDGGAWTGIRNGGTFDLASEGPHNVEVTARDVAGNWAPAKSQLMHVDGGPPSAPGLSLPRPVTADQTPTISWAASSDSGSGIQGYFVAIKRADGSTAGSQLVGPETTSIESPATLDDGQSYTVEVTAFDGADPAWTSTGTRAFSVDGSPSVTKVDPGEGAVFDEDSSPTFRVTLDRPANPDTVVGNVFLDRHDESGPDPVVDARCLNRNDCTTIDVTPTSPLEEGRYALRVDGGDAGLKSDEGTGFTPFAAAYSVTFLDNASVTASSTCPVGGTTVPRSLNTGDDAENATVTFNASGAWTVQVLNNANSFSSASGGAGAGSHTFAMPTGSSSISFRFCGSGSPSITDIRAWRNPRSPSFP